MNRLTLGAKINLGSGAILLCVVLMTGLGYLGATSLVTSVRSAHDVAELNRAVTKALEQFERLDESTLAVAQTWADDESQQLLAEEVAAATTALVAVRPALSAHTRLQEQLSVLDGLVAQAGDGRRQLIGVRAQERSEASERKMNALRSMVDQLHGDVAKVLREVSTELYAEFDLRIQATYVARTRLLNIGIAIVCALVIVIIVGAALLRRHIVSPLLLLTRGVARVADGHLDERLPAGSRDELGDLANAFNEMVASLRGLESHVRDVAAGNLSRTVVQQGDLAVAFNSMILAQRELVRQIADTAVQLNAAGGEFLANAKQQQRGATEQSSAIERTRHSIEALHASADQIAASASDVFANAERAQQNAQVVSERIAALSAHTRRIAEILDVIKGIANKSDLLALNAALEGTKAGEAGRGFSLVATQMQRLAESVMRSVADIKDLTTNVTEATQATVLATELSQKLAADTTRSAQGIGTMSTEQQRGSEQATAAMQGVAEVAVQTAQGAKEIVASATDLNKLSGHLQGLVGRFRLDGGAREPSAADVPVLEKRAEKPAAEKRT